MAASALLQPHSSGLRSFQASYGARARHPGTLSQPPWRPRRSSTTSGWTPLPTCGAPEEGAKEGGGDEGTGGGAPQTTPWGPGRGREGGGTATARPPGYSPRRGPRSTTTCGRAFQCPIVVLVGRPRRSAASADRQVRWRALAVVPCRHKLTGWKEAVMGGGRGAGGQEGGMALAEERRSSPNAHPSFPPSLTPERSGAGATSRTAPSTRGGRGPGGNRRAQHHRSRSWAPSSTDLQDQETPSSTDLQDQERARRRRGHRAAAAALLTAPTEGPGA